MGFSTASFAYPLLLLAGIACSLAFWSRLARRDERLFYIYLAALIGAFAGAKFIYLAAEGWLFWNDPHRWQLWAAGKSILGALLGGYAGVELAKHALGYQSTTGDWFALIAPVGILFGRVGCLLQGCCPGRECASSWWTMRDTQGIPRWPAVPVEIGFNLVALGAFAVLRRRRILPGQHFHLYLISYGIFRLLHESLRATPRIGGNLSGYQFAAAAVLVLGVWGFVQRQRDRTVSAEHLRS